MRNGATAVGFGGWRVRRSISNDISGRPASSASGPASRWAVRRYYGYWQAGVVGHEGKAGSPLPPARDGLNLLRSGDSQQAVTTPSTRPFPPMPKGALPPGEEHGVVVHGTAGSPVTHWAMSDQDAWQNRGLLWSPGPVCRAAGLGGFRTGSPVEGLLIYGPPVQFRREKSQSQVTLIRKLFWKKRRRVSQHPIQCSSIAAGPYT